MIIPTIGSDARDRGQEPRNYCVHLKISAADREDAWDLLRMAMRYGGVEIDDCCFAFATEEQWQAAMDALRFQFGPEYFEGVKPTEEQFD